MAREYGIEFPERPLMAVISDLLGIKHFSTSRGSTVRRDFLEAVAKGLGVPSPTVAGMATKDDVLSLVVETATGMSMDSGLFSPGYTVKNEVLQVIADGIMRNGVNGRPEVPDTEVRLLDGTEDDLGFDPTEFKDERDRKLMEMATREGRDGFRSALLDAYGGCCAVTGFNAPETLQAAHIYPYRGEATNRVTNGLLLRADLHLLFDRGAWSVDEETYRLLVKPHISLTSYAAVLREGTWLQTPKQIKFRPSRAALRSHRQWAGL